MSHSFGPVCNLSTIYVIYIKLISSQVGTPLQSWLMLLSFHILIIVIHYLLISSLHVAQALAYVKCFGTYRSQIIEGFNETLLPHCSSLDKYSVHNCQCSVWSFWTFADVVGNDLPLLSHSSFLLDNSWGACWQHSSIRQNHDDFLSETLMPELELTTLVLLASCSDQELIPGLLINFSLIARFCHQL